MFNIFKIFKKPVLPSERINMLALSGAVLLMTTDKRYIVLKPFLARHIAKKLVMLADLAEAGERNPALGVPAEEYFKHLLAKKGK